MKNLTVLVTLLYFTILCKTTLAQNDSMTCHTNQLYEEVTDNLYQENPAFWAGSCRSYNGHNHTPRGNLRVLIVYVVYNNAQPDGNSSWWPENGIPNFAALNGAPNDVIDSDPNNPTNRHNLSTWYRTMSNGMFTLTGEIIKVSIDFSNDHKERELRAIQAIGSTYPNKDWSSFDKRQNLWKYWVPNVGYKY